MAGNTIRTESMQAARGSVPPPQRPYELALAAGLERLCARRWSAACLEGLGACLAGQQLAVTALGRRVIVDLERKTVGVDGSGVARAAWAVLITHYLCAEDWAVDMRDVAFAEFHDGSSYRSVFAKRITGRFLGTTGRTAEQFARAAETEGGLPVPGGGQGYRFFVLPRVPVTLIRYEGDDELRPGASVVYRADAGHLLSAEDRVVAAEVLLDTLAGKPMTEPGGTHEQRH